MKIDICRIDNMTIISENFGGFDNKIINEEIDLKNILHFLRFIVEKDEDIKGKKINSITISYNIIEEFFNEMKKQVTKRQNEQ